MADQLPAEEDLDRLPTDEELGRLQRTTVLYYLHETNPANGLVRDKTDPRAMQHRRRRPRSGDDPGCRRARRDLREFAPKIARRRLRFFSTARTDRGRTPPGTRASTTTSWTWRPAAASGTASSPRSTRRSCSRACSPAPPTSTPTRRTKPRSGDWPTRSTAGPTGTGRCNGGAALSHGWKPETGFIPHR